MKTCAELDCENYCEGNTDLCASHNHLARKASRLALVEKKKPKSIKPRSEKRSAIEAVYNAEVKEWKIDKVCLVRVDGEIVCGVDCEENHHKKGRDGEMLMVREFWFPVCTRHHRMITDYPEWAIRNGYSLLRLPTNTTI